MNFKALATAALATVSIATVATPAHACYDAYSCAQQQQNFREQQRRQDAHRFIDQMQQTFTPQPTQRYDIDCNGMFGCSATPSVW